MARTPPARTAGQRPLIAGVAVVVLAVATPALLTELDQREAAQEQASDSAAPPAPSPEPGRTAEVVGPVRGADIATYVDDRTAALLEAPATVDTAVVSFTDVLPVDDALVLVEQAGTVRAVLYRLPLEQASPQVVRVGAGDDVVAALTGALRQQLEPLRTEEASTRELLDSGTVGDPDFIAEYERRLAELEAALAAAESGAVVHGVVVRGAIDDLRSLVDATGVRLVDPAPPGTDVAESDFQGLLPGDTTTTTFGRAS